MVTFAKNLVFLTTILVMSPVALLGFVWGACAGAFRAGVRMAESFFDWICS
jgi:hypothetical protein